MTGIIVLLTIAARISGGCELRGSEAIARDTRVKFVWAGETHGTEDQPKLFGDLLCALEPKRSRIIVALERPKSEQVLWNDYLRSDGGRGAREKLLSGLLFQSAMKDGRGSSAQVDLAERLRQFYQRGRLLGVAMIVPDLAPRSIDDAARYEADMGRNVLALGSMPNVGLVAVLTGRVHARRGFYSFGAVRYKTAANYVPNVALANISISSERGTAWTCEDDGCGRHPLPGLPHRRRELTSGGAPDVFKFVAHTGVPATASPPAVSPR